MEMITIEAVNTGWLYLWLLGVIVILVLSGLTASRQDSGTVAGITVGLAFVYIIAVPAGIDTHTENLVHEHQVAAMSEQLGIDNVRIDDEQFTGSQEGKYVAGEIIDAGDNRYIINFLDSK